MAGEQAGRADEWGALRDDALEMLDRLLHVATDTHEDLQRFSEAVARYRKHLAADGTAADFAVMINLASTRGSLSDRMAELERARNSARVALWKLHVAEGASIAEVAREWGLSRQLVSRAISAPTPSVEPPGDAEKD